MGLSTRDMSCPVLVDTIEALCSRVGENGQPVKVVIIDSIPDDFHSRTAAMLKATKLEPLPQESTSPKDGFNQFIRNKYKKKRR